MFWLISPDCIASLSFFHSFCRGRLPKNCWSINWSSAMRRRRHTWQSWWTSTRGGRLSSPELQSPVQMSRTRKCVAVSAGNKVHPSSLVWELIRLFAYTDKSFEMSVQSENRTARRRAGMTLAVMIGSSPSEKRTPRNYRTGRVSQGGRTRSANAFVKSCFYNAHNMKHHWFLISFLRQKTFQGGLIHRAWPRSFLLH